MFPDDLKFADVSPIFKKDKKRRFKKPKKQLQASKYASKSV